MYTLHIVIQCQRIKGINSSLKWDNEWKLQWNYAPKPILYAIDFYIHSLEWNSFGKILHLRGVRVKKQRRN